jgi:hypothetical protein
MSCGNNCTKAEFLGREKRTFNIAESQEVDLSLVVSFKFTLLTNTPVVVEGERLESAGDEYCDQSNWPYLIGSKLTVNFDEDNQAAKNLRVTICRLVPNPNYCEQTHEH